MKKAVIYSRVSTDEQTKGYSLNTQIDECKEYISRKGYQLLETFQDDFTGAMLDRPGLNHLRDYVAYTKIDVIIVYDLDRLARKSVHQAIIEEEFNRLGIHIEYVLGQYEDTDEGKLQKQIRASIAEYEKAKILERSKRGKRGKAKSGFVLVGSRPPYGYKVIAEPHKAWLAIEDDEAQVVRDIFHWYLYGDENNVPMSMMQISGKLTALGIPTRGDKEKHFYKKHPAGFWSDAMIRKVLRNQTYVGIWHYGKTKIFDDGVKRNHQNKRGFGKQIKRDPEEWITVQVPAIISQEEFEAVQKRIEVNARQAKRNIKREYLMAKRLKCGNCGYTYQARTVLGKAKHKYYYCKGKAQRFLNLCDMPSFKVETVDAAIWEWIRGLIEDPQSLEQGLLDVQEESRQSNQAIYNRIDLIESQISDTQSQIERLLELFLSGDFDKSLLIERKNRLDDNLQKLQGELADTQTHLDQKEISQDQIMQIEEFCSAIREGLEHADFEARRRIIELLDVNGKLAIENNRKVIYAKCLLTPQPVSLALTSPSLNTGGIATSTIACRLIIPSP